MMSLPECELDKAWQETLAAASLPRSEATPCTGTRKHVAKLANQYWLCERHSAAIDDAMHKQDQGEPIPRD